MKTIETKLKEDRLAFIQSLPLIHAEAVRLGLYITGRALHNAVKASGWEVSGDPSKAAVYAPDLEDK